MEILVIFESVEGQTRKIANFVAEQIRAAGHNVELFNTAERQATVSLEGVDRVVLAAPVHERRHPIGFEVLVSARNEDLQARPTLLISVSLKAAFPKEAEEAQEYLTELKMRTKFTPTIELLVAGAVRSGSYSYYESQILQHVVLGGQKVDLSQDVHEFTDWDQLRADVEAFVQG